MQLEDALKLLKTCFTLGDLEGAQNVVRHLVDAHERCHTLLAQANDAILVFRTQDARIVDFNNKAIEITGYSEMELRQATICSLHPQEHREEIKANYLRVVEMGPHIIRKVPLICKDGRQFWMDISAASYQTDHETLIQGIFHDVTERYFLLSEIEERAAELERKNTQLEEAQQVQREFLAQVSHELRTPLNSIIGYNSLLEEGVYGELQTAQKKATQRIDRNATRLLALINQLLELSRLEAGVISVFQEEVNLVGIMQEVLEEYQVVAEEKGIDLKLSHPYKGLRVKTDRDKIREIVRQIVSNAVQYTDQGTVHIDVGEETGEGFLRIQDSGPGIDPSKHDRIFGLFHRGESPTAGRYEGSGLGLAIAKRLADRLGVKIDLDSTVGQGSTFTLRFTEIVGVETVLKINEDAAPPNVLPIEEGSPAHVLIVDDDPYTVEMLSDFIESRGGYRVQRAYSGMHAMIHLAQTCPAYLIVDLLMPMVNGERVIQYCRELWGDQVKIIVITGKSLSSKEKEILQSKADAILQKGNVPHRSLIKALEQILPALIRA